MSEKGELEFLLKGSFIFPNAGDVLAYPQVPSCDDDSGVCSFVKEYFGPKTTLESLFEKVYQYIIENKKNYYVIPKRVVILPHEDPNNVYECVQLVKSLLHHVFTSDQIKMISLGFSKEAIQSLSTWQKYVLDSSFVHFHKIMTNPDVCQNQEQRLNFIHHVLHLYSPKFDNAVYYTSMFKLRSGKLGKGSKWSGILSAEKDKVIADGEVLKFTDSDIVNQRELTLNSGQISFTHTADTSCLRAALQGNADPIDAVLRSIPDTTKGFNPKVVSRAVGHSSPEFIDWFYARLSDLTDQKRSTKLRLDLIRLFGHEGTHMMLLKYLAYNELQRTGSSNTLFRQNNDFIRTLIQFINEAGADFQRTTVVELVELVGRCKAWSYDDPQGDDTETARQLIDDFMGLLVSRIDTVPASIRSLCRFLRVLSEHEFMEPELSHRAVYALFLLRFLFVVMTDPQLLEGAAVSGKTFGKSVQFSKLLSNAAQMTTINDKTQKKRVVFNEAIVKTYPSTKRFYEALTAPCDASALSVSEADLEIAAKDIAEFLSECAPMAAVRPDRGGDVADIFARELVAEYIA